MNIDRKRFLFLAATLSATTAAALVTASGCTINTTNNASDGGGGTPSVTPTPDSDSGSGNVDTDAGTSPTACLADKTPAPSCEGLDGGAAARCGQCNSYNHLFKGEVAAAIRTCLDQAPTCEGSTTSCAEQALAQGCEDTTGTSFCQTALACTSTGGAGIDGGYDGGPDPMADCVNVVRSLSAEGREEFQNCLNDFGGACGQGTLHDCIRGTLDPN